MRDCRPRVHFVGVCRPRVHPIFRRRPLVRRPRVHRPRVRFPLALATSYPRYKNQQLSIIARISHTESITSLLIIDVPRKSVSKLAKNRLGYGQKITPIFKKEFPDTWAYVPHFDFNFAICQIDQYFWMKLTLFDKYWYWATTSLPRRAAQASLREIHRMSSTDVLHILSNL